jgi:membrane peptidoglycan carboxypeptidase
MDTQTEFPNQGGKSYNPVNYDGKYRGPVQYRFALANSLNIPAVKILAQVGIKNFLQTSYDMGIEEFEPTQENVKRFGLSATLGGGETSLLNLTNAYSTFARGGEKLEPSAILEIRDYKDKVIYKAKDPKPRRVIGKDISFIISHILSDNSARSAAFGSNSFLHIPGKTVSVKTGTTNDKRDNWAVGYTKAITVGTWVGNNDNSPMNPRIASGLTGASPIWHKIMKHMLATYNDGIIDKPDNVQALQIDSLVGGLPKDNNPIRSEYFVDGTEPKEVSDMYKKVKVSKSDNSRLANEVEVRSGDYDEKDYIVLSENDPISTDGHNRWQDGIYAWIDSQADDRYKVPRSTSESRKDEIVVHIKEPGNETRTDSNTVHIRATIASLSRIKKVEVFANNSNIATYNEEKKEIDESVNLSNGMYTIRIRAENDKGQTNESSIKIGVNMDWNAQPTSVPPTSTIAPTMLIPSIFITP